MGKLRTMFDALQRLAGRLPPTRSTDKSGFSVAATKIREILSALDVTRLTDPQRAHLGRVLAAGVSGLRAEAAWQAGVKTKDWTPAKGRPAARKHPESGYDWAADYMSWCDHATVETDKDGRKLYVSEPYALHANGLAALLELAKTWDVRVTGMSGYFPGHTVRVEIRAKLPKD